MEIRAGTSGFAYKEWKGTFYPETLPARAMLGFYAERLAAVEINNTFYRLPKPSVLAGWADQVPESFRFVIKASRRITHFKRLRGTEDETGYLLRTCESLGARLGALLFQLPPNLPADLQRLDAFLALLPEGTRAAFEFRHPSWVDARVHDRLRDHGAALCLVDDEDQDLSELVATAAFATLRLRRPDYSDAALEQWAARVTRAPWQEAFVFFKHEAAGAAPRLAARLQELAAGELRRRPRRVARARRRPADAGEAG